MKIDNKKKAIIIGRQAFEKMDASEVAKLANYKAIGYTIEVQEAKRPKADKTNEAAILKALAGDQTAIATYQAKKAAGGFFAAKKWFKENY